MNGNSILFYVYFGKLNSDTFFLKNLITFIEILQEKQTENVVEKLCLRFRNADSERQWRDIAFCLSLLPFSSDKSLKKLAEGLHYYQDKLHEETLFKSLMDIISKVNSKKQKCKSLFIFIYLF